MSHTHVRDLGYQVNRLARLMRTSMSREIADIGLTPQQGAVLLNCGISESLTLSDVAERVGVDRPSMSGIVERLVRDGWLATHPNPTDGRSRLLSLTEQGIAVVPALGAAAARTSALAVAGLSSHDAAALFESIARVADNLDQHSHRGSHS